MSDPSLYSLASRLGNFELDKATGLLSHHHNSRSHLPAVRYIGHPEFHHVVGAELGVDCQIEQG